MCTINPYIYENSLFVIRPKDSPSIGLTQIAVLGSTIFASPTNGAGLVNNSICSTSSMSFEQAMVDDSFAKTSVGWVRILSRCYSAASKVPSDSKLAADVIGASASYPGFLEACCSLMNIMPMIPNAAVQNLESVLLKLGAYNRDLCISLIRTLLWGTSPQSMYNGISFHSSYNLSISFSVQTFKRKYM